MANWLTFTIMAAVCFGIAAAMQKDGMAAEFPRISLKTFLSEWRSVPRALLANRSWTGGFLLGLLGGAFYFQALSSGDISIIQPLMNIAMLTSILAGVFFLRERLSAAEWTGIGVLLAGAAALCLSTRPPGIPSLRPMALLWLSVIAAVFSALLAVLPLLFRRFASVELVMAALAGMGFGMGAIFIKAATLDASHHFGGFSILRSEIWLFMLTSYPIWLVLVSELMGMASFQAAFSHGRVALVSPVTTLVSIIVPVIAGAVVFGEIIEFTRGLGIGGVIAGTALLAAWATRPGRP